MRFWIDLFFPRKWVVYYTVMTYTSGEEEVEIGRYYKYSTARAEADGENWARAAHDQSKLEDYYKVKLDD